MRVPGPAGPPDRSTGAEPNPAGSGAPGGGGPAGPPGPRAETRRAAAVALVLAAVGAPLGLLWALAVPHVGVFAVDGAPRYLLPDASEDRAAAAGDVLMLCLLAAAGLLAALLVARSRARELVGSVAGLVGGGALAGVIAMAVGHALVQGDYRPLRTAAEGVVVQVRPYVRGDADWAAFPLAGSLVLLMRSLPALWRGDPDPG